METICYVNEVPLLYVLPEFDERMRPDCRTVQFVYPREPESYQACLQLSLGLTRL
ncbi:hypothetical protein D3C71_2096200 [compost metagenome]